MSVPGQVTMPVLSMQRWPSPAHSRNVIALFRNVRRRAGKAIWEMAPSIFFQSANNCKDFEISREPAHPEGRNAMLELGCLILGTRGSDPFAANPIGKDGVA